MSKRIRNLKLQLGQFVEASKNLDPDGADVSKNMRGIVIAPNNYFGDGCGPLIRWENGGTCNVYKGDIKTLEGRVVINAVDNNA